jgi:peptidoglycan hydrolase CwlO-like protein
MKNEGKIVELLAEMLHKFDVLTGRVDSQTGVLNNVQQEIVKLNGEVHKLNKEVHKLNLVSAENSRAIMKLADTHESRIVRLEQAVFKH